MVALVVVGVAWLLHGMLLSDLARDFLGERLRQEAQYTIQRLKRHQPLVSPGVASGSPASQVFHHLYLLRLDGEITTSHPRWKEPLTPLLDSANEALIDIHWQGRHLLVYRQAFTIDGQAGVLLIAEDYESVESGLDSLHWWVGGAAGLLLLLLILLNLIAVNRSLRPLSRLQGQLAEFQAGQRERLDLKAPSELDGLLYQLNHFMDELQRRLNRSREAVANLSHTLHTPLAAVTQVLRGRRPIDDHRRRQMLARLEGMQAQLHSELRRARFAGPGSGQHAVVVREAEALIDMLGTLYPDKRFELQTSLAAHYTMAIERQDLSEILGIVLDNAGKWARRDIVCRLYANNGLKIEIEDDGPGVEPSELSQLGQRGSRLDESTPGHGLGLAILKQLIDQYAGKLAFLTSRGGGLRVHIQLPG
ncbi:Signal transduction histidine kinase [Modicisalibacter muralis]|uniref:histidine kinase n=1 Tax=Modicisalibacter muralis TaxID=119000 RepID=A0A1G9KFK6_9GAMM|nr:Signal transduction histidine kinase [Halomonas muralis]